MGAVRCKMLLLLLEILGLFSINCYEGNVPCEAESPATQELLKSLKPFQCTQQFDISEDCRELMRKSDIIVEAALNNFLEGGGNPNMNIKKDQAILVTPEFKYTRDQIAGGIPNEQSILYAMAVLGYGDAVNTLLEHGSSVDAGQDDGWTPLMGATYNSKNFVIKTLLKHGANINATTIDTGDTALHFAVQQYSRDIVALLLENEADPRIENKNGLTAMDLTKNDRVKMMIWNKLNGYSIYDTSSYHYYN